MAERLWRAGAVACGAALLAAAITGCSLPVDSMFDSSEPDLTPTGSIPASIEPNASGALQGSDLAMARAAAIEVLARDDKGASQSWENPTTGARGTVTPLAASYTSNGMLCRDFLASYVHGGSEAWLQGEACRVHQGRWEVRNLKPWKRT
jgi:surface antigen